MRKNLNFITLLALVFAYPQAKSDNLAANRITHVGGAWLAST